MIKLIARKFFLSVIAVSLILGVGAITVPAVFAQADEGTWNIQTVDDVDVISTSLALDSNGYPHIAYAGGGPDSLYYARWTGTAWETEMVDDVFVAIVSLELDSHDRPHIAYSSGGDGSLHYIWWTGTAWERRGGEDPVDVRGVRDCSLALDSDGYPNISYTSSGFNSLHYARWSGTDWETGTVYDVSATSTSLALDGHDRPHIAYATGGPFSLHYTHWTGTTWAPADTVDSILVSNCSLALDSQGRPRIAYASGGLTSLHYARWTGAAWAKETVDPADVSDCSLALDSQGCPHISYRVEIRSFDGDTLTLGSMLKYACLTGSAWDIQEVDQDTITLADGFFPIVFLSVSKWSSIALDGNDLPHISYGNLVSSIPLSLHYAYIPPQEEEELPPPSGPGVSPTIPRHLKPSNISLQFLSINPQQTYANQSVTITTNAVNTGDDAGNINVALKINGMVEQSRMVSVGAHGTQPVQFTVTKSQPGTYDVDVLGKTGSFTVLGAGGTAGSNTGALIVLALLGILVIASLVVLLVRRA